MPAISLVVCVYRQRDLLERLLRESQGCYDELVVLHDIPDVQNIREVVEGAGGRFFEMQPSTQEPQWPFAWGQAKQDWILRLDTDEYPSDEMKKWLQEFRRAPEPPAEVPGYTCIWPLWDGRRAVTKKWPAGRPFLFNKQRVRFFGMNEMSPIPDGQYLFTALILRHEHGRKGYGLGTFLRPQAMHGIKFIAQCLTGKPTDLKCWRWEDEQWPPGWEQIRRRPFWTAFKRLTKGPLRSMYHQWRAEKKIFPSVAIGSAVHDCLICFIYWRLRRAQGKNEKIR